MKKTGDTFLNLPAQVLYYRSEFFQALWFISGFDCFEIYQTFFDYLRTG